MILQCKILCFDKQSEENGIEPEEIWVNCCIDLGQVAAIKEDITADLVVVPDTTIIYLTNGREMIVNVPYNILSARWIKAKQIQMFTGEQFN